MRYTSKSLLATEFGMSNTDLEEYRYHYGHTTKPVYAIGNDYYCAVKEGQKPAKPTDGGMAWEWKQYTSKLAASNGWQIWEARA